jgi:hypothetical protein
MKRAMLPATLLTAAIVSLSVPRAHAQCNPTCQGDFNLDGQVTVDEIIVSVNNALNGCGGTEQQGCIDSGGTVATALCCASAPDFPDTCAIGVCGCAPTSSHEVSICDCPESTCFDRGQGACVASAK